MISGHTEYQTAGQNRARRSVRFERKPSQRYSRRPTFERHEKEERLKRERESRRKESDKKTQRDVKEKARCVARCVFMCTVFWLNNFFAFICGKCPSCICIAIIRNI